MIYTLQSPIDAIEVVAQHARIAQPLLA
jgi:hypothetical protein